MSSFDTKRINGWTVKYLPDFVKFYSSSRYLLRLNLGNEEDAREIINQKVRAICNSASPQSSAYPKLGNMKWLKAKKGVKIQEERLTGDYRILFLPTNSELDELTFFAIRDHDGVVEFLRDAHARVHNAAIDEFQIWDWEKEVEYSVDMSVDGAEDIVERIQQRWSQFLGVDEVERNQTDFLEVSRRSSIYRLGEFGIELDPSNEQIEHINSPSPMLLPGVAGTGKSTVLQYRFRDAILSYGNQKKKFFSKGIYLTLNSPLAKSTQREVKKILPKEVWGAIDGGGVQDINTWVSSLLEEESAVASPNLTFETFRKWWSRRTHLSNYDPAQAWEEYRGVIKGTCESINYDDGALSAEAYLNLPHDRCAYPPHQRRKFYLDIIQPFQEFRKQSDSVMYDDQDLIRKVKQSQLPALYKHIFIDEVQDLTELQLMVIMEMLTPATKCVCSPQKDGCTCAPSCLNCHCLIFDAAGDLSQQVYPTRFRWEDTSRAIFESQGRPCHVRKPMKTSYRSVRSIVDLSTFYLKRMDNTYRQANNDEILQAQAEQKAETPSVLEGTETELFEVLYNAKLPAAHSPIITRDEASKRAFINHFQQLVRERTREKMSIEFPGSEEVQQENYSKQVKIPLQNISNYTLTIAEAKGLEWNNVILWGITSGSDYLLERKLHERQGNYINDGDWNFQLELRHAFVATTRARLLLLHLATVREVYHQNPFFTELLTLQLVAEEKTPVDLSRFSKVELTAEEYEEMAEDYGNKEMFGAAALIYRNNLGDEKRATKMEFFDAKKSNEILRMAEFLILYEKSWQDSTLGRIEIEHVLGLLDDEGDSTELGFIIELAEMVGHTVRAKLARIKRKEILAKMFKTPEAFSNIADEYQDLNEFDKAGDFFEKAGDHARAIACWWKSESFSKAWKRIGAILVPNKDPKRELLWIALLTDKNPSENSKKLFHDIFGVEIYPDAIKSLRTLDIQVTDLTFSTTSGKEKARKITFDQLSPEERAALFFKGGNWKLGLEIFIEELHLKLSDGLKFCKSVPPTELLGWYKEKISSEPKFLRHDEKYAFFVYHFQRSLGTKATISKVNEYLMELKLEEANRPLPGAGSLLQKWYHALHLVKNPQSAYTGPGRMNLQVAIRWYSEHETVESDLLLHSLRCGLFAALEKTFAEFIESEGKGTDALKKSNIERALPCFELYLKTLMNPKRFSRTNYGKIRKNIIAMVKHSGLYDFLDGWFDFFLDMEPDAKLLNDQRSLRRDIQIIFPVFRNHVAGNNQGLPSLNCEPYDSLTRKFDSDRKQHSFSTAGMEVLEGSNYTKGQWNAVKKIVNELDGEMDFLLEVYIKRMLLDHSSKIEPKSFFEIIDGHLQEHARESLDTDQEIKDEQQIEEELSQPIDDLEEEDEHEIEPSGEEPSFGIIDDNEMETEDLNTNFDLEEDSFEEDIGEDENGEMGEDTDELEILRRLHDEQPENVNSWFDQNFKSSFHEGNIPWIMRGYNSFLERLEQIPEKFSIHTVNEWLCFHEIMKILRAKFSLSENPFIENQRIAANLAEARRSVASMSSSFSKEKVSALIKIR